ncbi:MAG: hypothetical protein MJ231_03575 [bacterium]|nr:hypothetical protein [bacterium]
MEVSKVSFQGAKFARRMTMTPTKKKIHAKNIVTISANESKQNISKWLNLFKNDKCMNFYKFI